MPRVKLDDLRRNIGNLEILKGIDLTIEDGEFTVLVGPSGCGKTTLLRLIAGLDEASGGQVSIGDTDVTGLEPRERDVAMVFQNYALYPHMSVYENMEFGLKARRIEAAEIESRVARAAGMLGIDDLLGRKPGELSGGQQQRVAIGRAVVRNPRVFLFDEPLSNLDARLRIEMRTELLKLHRGLGATVIYVTHDQEEAMTMGDRIVVMNEGSIQQVGTPREIFFQPNNLLVAGFIGSPPMNRVPGRISDGKFESQGGEIILAAEALPIGPAILGIRPEDIHLPGDLAVERKTGEMVGRVEVIELLGARAIVTLTMGGLEFKAVFEERYLDDIGMGRDLTVVANPGRLHFFDAETGLRTN